MCDTPNPERGVPVNIPITLFGYTETHRFRKFEPPYLERELARLADARVYYGHRSNLGANLNDVQPKEVSSHASVSVDQGACPIAYTVSIQPCPDPDKRSQDRYVVESWDIQGGMWMFAAVFDGHAGEGVAEWAHRKLPGSVRQALDSLIGGREVLEPNVVSSMLSECIRDLDDAIVRSLRLLFAPEESASTLQGLKGDALLDFTSPGAYAADLERVTAMSVEEIKHLINDKKRGGTNWEVIEKCKQGSTVLVALVDPLKENVWVAGAGDCVAVLGSTKADVSPAQSPTEHLDVEVLSEEHNGRLHTEYLKTHAEHPGETTCLFRSRVLGAIAVTRALGDMLFKLPAQYTRRVLMNSVGGFQTSTPVSEIIQRVITPPYLTAAPHVRYVYLGKGKGHESPDEGSVGRVSTRDDDDVEVANVSMSSEIAISILSASADGATSTDSEVGDDMYSEVEGLGLGVRPGITGDPSLAPLQTTSQPRRFIIMCSDGLVDLQGNESVWAHIVDESLRNGSLVRRQDTVMFESFSPSSPQDVLSHPALHLLKHSFGGDDSLKVSALLSLESMGRWMDDTTIIVLPL